MKETKKSTQYINYKLKQICLTFMRTSLDNILQKVFVRNGNKLIRPYIAQPTTSTSYNLQPIISSFLFKLSHYPIVIKVKLCPKFGKNELKS